LLCTPAAVPPRWACAAYPDINPVLENGRAMGFGGRRYTCPTSPNYLRLGEAIAGAMGARFGTDRRVMGWQLDNEFGHPFCFCDRCLGEFQAWCARRFRTIDRFNDALVMSFWGQTLTDFDQVMFPTSYSHPGLWQLYHQFFSDMTVACYARQASALRAAGAEQPITTNIMPTWYGYDHEAMVRHFDVIGVDHYGLNPDTLFGEPFLNEAFVQAYSRGLTPGRPIWFHEFQWGKGCGRGSYLPLPGQVRWGALTQLGMGANLVSFFRVDVPPAGAERDAFGLLGADGQPGRIYSEVKDLGAEIAELATLLEGSVPAPAEVAVLFTYHNHVEFARNNRLPETAGPFGNGYAMHLAKHFGAVARQNIPCDIVYPSVDFSAYQVIIAPALYVLPEELGAKLAAWAAAGGTLLLTALSGVVDEHGTMHDAPAPGPLRAAAGVTVRDSALPHPYAGPVTIRRDRAMELPDLHDVRWLDEILPDAGTEVLARYDNAFYRDIPVLTRREYGAGSVYYLGALLTQDGYNALYRALAPLLGLRPILDLPEGIYVTERISGDRRIRFFNNPHPDAREVTVEGETVALEAFGVRVIG
ncbi:MAG TPA: beta-galactosidase, partial [Armatimonadota bacterium]|nr:beta-galactosidase [Armatimonadota bacterium]